MLTQVEDLYPSRVDDRPRICPRIDPVVYDNPPVVDALTADGVRGFASQGFLSLTPFSLDEVARLNGELSRLVADEAIRHAPETITERNNDAVVRSIFRIHELSPVFDELTRDPRLLDVARQILGSEVYLHQSRVNFKPGFAGKEFYWHSDFETWHVEDGMPRMRALSVSVALTENSPHNGPLMLIPGSHLSYVSCIGATPHEHYRRSLKQQAYGVPDCDSLEHLVRAGGIAVPIGTAGSATFFDCNTMHGSNSNITPFPRTNLFFVYNSVENELTDPFCGLPPRPDYIGARGHVVPLRPMHQTAWSS